MWCAVSVRHLLRFGFDTTDSRVHGAILPVSSRRKPHRKWIASASRARNRDATARSGASAPRKRQASLLHLGFTEVYARRLRSSVEDFAKSWKSLSIMLISRAGRKCSSRYSRYGVSTSSIHFMNARTRRDRLLRCATTRDTASPRRRKSGMISTSAPLSKYRPIPKSGA